MKKEEEEQKSNIDREQTWKQTGKNNDDENFNHKT